MADPHWTEKAEWVAQPGRAAANPLVGLLAESDAGVLLLPAWRNPRRDDYPGGWWNRRLDLRNPLHWLPYLRSRLTGSLVWVEAASLMEEDR